MTVRMGRTWYIYPGKTRRLKENGGWKWQGITDTNRQNLIGSLYAL